MLSGVAAVALPNDTSPRPSGPRTLRPSLPPLTDTHRPLPVPRLASGGFPTPHNPLRWSPYARGRLPAAPPSALRWEMAGWAAGEGAEPGVADVPASRGGLGCARLAAAAALGRRRRRRRRRGSCHGGAASARTGTGRERAAGRGGPGAWRAGLGGADGPGHRPRPAPRRPSFSLSPKQAPAARVPSCPLPHPRLPGTPTRTPRAHTPHSPSAHPDLRHQYVRTDPVILVFPRQTTVPTVPYPAPPSTYVPRATLHPAPRCTWTHCAHLYDHAHHIHSPAGTDCPLGKVRTSRSLLRNRLLQLISLSLTDLCIPSPSPLLSQGPSPSLASATSSKVIPRSPSAPEGPVCLDLWLPASDTHYTCASASACCQAPFSNPHFLPSSHQFQGLSFQYLHFTCAWQIPNVSLSLSCHLETIPFPLRL